MGTCRTRYQGTRAGNNAPSAAQAKKHVQGWDRARSLCSNPLCHVGTRSLRNSMVWSAIWFNSKTNATPVMLFELNVPFCWFPDRVVGVRSPYHIIAGPKRSPPPKCVPYAWWRLARVTDVSSRWERLRPWRQRSRRRLKRGHKGPFCLHPMILAPKWGSPSRRPSIA